MAYFATELATPPPLNLPDGGGGTIEVTFPPGMGYPTGGAPGSATYPNMPAVPPVATNPHGVANTPDEYPAVIANPPGTKFAYAYSPQTFEEKIAQMVPPGVPVVPVTVAANQPYPTTP